MNLFVAKKPIFIFPIFILLLSCGGNKSTTNDDNVIMDIFSEKKVDAEAVGKDVQAYLGANPSFLVFEKDTFRNIKELQEMYTANESKSIWLSSKGVSKNANTILAQIDSLQKDGLEPNELYLQSLKKLADKINNNNANAAEKQQFDLGLSLAATKACNAMIHGGSISKDYNKDWFNKQDSGFVASKHIMRFLLNDSAAYTFNSLKPSMPEYAKFKNKLQELLNIKQAGGWPMIDGLKDSLLEGIDYPNLPKLRKRLQLEIGVPTNLTSTKMDADVRKAILQFQYQQDLRLSGKLDTSTLKKLNITVGTKINILKNNLERLRWIQKDLHQPYIWVNIPRMELEYKDKDTTQFKMRVVVGRKDRPTPTLNAVMSNVVINPGWSVPPTIMKEEIVPGIGRRGNGYLKRKGLKAFYRGREVDASRINANNFKQFSIQQKPGLNSALGAVKFNMPNPHAIYLHDTPHRNDFVKYYRAYSSGCVRVEKPRDFAEFVLQDTNYSKPKIDSMIRKKITKEVVMKKKVEVHLVYLTNGLDSAGNVLYLRDIYNKDAEMQTRWK
jgi:L,D-transpeptidase YcbB